MSRRHSLRPAAAQVGPIAAGSAELVELVKSGAPLIVVLSAAIRWGDLFAGRLASPLERTAISRVMTMLEAALVSAIEVKGQAVDFGEDELLTVAEAAQMLRLSKGTVREWSSVGKLPAPIRYRKGGRLVFRRLLLSKWIADAERQVL